MQHNAKVLVGTTDHFPPDVQAMLQAMYSRSYAPIESRLPTTPESEQSLRSRLRQYFIGYGHKSVGQLGVSAIWFEGVSQLAAKAIEHHPLFNGQESSTRYIDFTHQPMVHFDDAFIQGWQERWRALYVKALPLMIEKLKVEYPFELTPAPPVAIGNPARNLVAHVEKEKTKWENTIKARAFDICGSLLPAGVTTNVVMSATFDTFDDHLGQMLRHPSPEMESLACEAIRGIAAKYPDATAGIEKLYQRNEYVTPDYFYAPPQEFLSPAHSEHYETSAYLKSSELTWDALKVLMAPRQRFNELPRHVAAKNRYKLQGFLDFRSFRDLHRHRNGVWLMPLLTTEHGFEEWYLQNLPTAIASEVRQLVQEMTTAFKAVGAEDAVRLQYAIPMGFRVPMSYDCHLGSLVYLFERRTDKTVHQTVRRYMHQIYQQFTHRGALTLNIHADLDEDNFSLKRGEQTFAGEFK